MIHRETKRQIIHYVLTSVGAMVVSFAYNVVDGMFVGQGVSETVLAAVKAFTEIMTALVSMLTIGAATVMAIWKG